MKVVVEILPEARQDLIGLLEPRVANPADAITFGYVYLADLEQQFQQHQGFPPGARRTRAPDGGEWWWRYVDGVWVVYRVTHSRRWFGGVTRRVTIVAFEATLPSA